MTILYNVLVALACLAFGYLFGCFSTSIAIGKIFFHQDPRNFGSKNPGGTNSGRLWGKKVGLLIILLDMIKTILPIWLAYFFLRYVKFDGKPLLAPIEILKNGNESEYLINWPIYWIVPLGSMLGHCYPIFYKFKGGKGVSNFFGMELGTCWGLFLSSGLIFITSLKIKKYVSLSSIIGSVSGAVFSWIWSILQLLKVLPTSLYSFISYGDVLFPNYVLSIILTMMSLILILRHKDNILRLRNKTESKITWLK